MHDIIKFILNPYSPSKYKKFSLSTFFKLLGIYLIWTICISIFAMIIFKFFEIDHNKVMMGSPLETIIIGVILAPIYEEVIFRSLLVFNKKSLIIFYVVATILIILGIINSKFIIISFLISYLAIITLSISIFDIQKIQSYINNHIAVFYYLSAFIFGLIHLNNFSGNLNYLILFSIIVTGPQIFLGLINGYVRLKYGLIYSIAIHMTVNLSILSYVFK